MIDKPQESHVAFQAALAESAQGLNPNLAKEGQTVNFYVGYEGSFGANHVSPRGLTSNYICQLVCVEGIATKIGLVKPKMVRSVHFCPATSKAQTKDYRDESSLVGDPTGSAYPTKDEEGNPLETEYGLCDFQNHQTLTIQEMPEHAPMGQIPCSTTVTLDDDLADSCKPGDRVQIVGIYRGMSGQSSGKTTGMFRTTLLATNVRVLTKDVRDENITDEDQDNIKEVSVVEYRCSCGFFANPRLRNRWVRVLNVKCVGLLQQKRRLPTERTPSNCWQDPSRRQFSATNSSKRRCC